MNSIPEVDYKGIFNSGSALYLILLPDAPLFTIVGASDIYLQATMRTREDIVGRGVFDAFPPNPNDIEGNMEKAFRAAFKRVMETKKVDVMFQQYDIPKPGGGFEVRHWSVTHTPILDAKGQLIQMAQRVEDVTELLRLKEAGDQMSNEVMLRAREIKEASNKLSEVNKDLESFNYTVSHDLRAPLRSIVSFGEILINDHLHALNDEGQDYLKRMVKAGKRMHLLIEGLLSLAKLSREKLLPENIDLTNMAHALKEQLFSSHEERNVEIEIAPDMKAIGDPRLLDLVLQNLLNNAWKFTARKPVGKIEIGQLKQGKENVFYVKDNGAGFNMQYAEKLFGPFQRLHTEAEFAGTGIGLATVQKIIHRHQGKIWAHAIEGEGATFFFTLSLEK